MTEKAAGFAIARYRQWVGRIAAAMSDQMLVAICHFALNVLLGRWLSVEEYGGFTVAYSCFLLVQTLYDSLLAEPFAVLGAGAYARYIQQYFARALLAHAVVSIAIVLILGAVAFCMSFSQSSVLAGALTGAAVAAPFLLLRTLLQQRCYVTGQATVVAFGSLLYAFSALAATTILHRLGALSPGSAFVALGSAAALSGSVLLAIVQPFGHGRSAAITSGDLLRRHWNFGGWGCGAQILGWSSSSIYYLAGPALLGLGFGAALKATANLILPVSMMLSAATTILLPTLVRSFEEEGTGAFRAKLRRLAIGYVWFALGWTLFVMPFGRQISHALYAGAYDNVLDIQLLAIVATLPVVSAFGMLMDAALRTMRGTRQIFYSKATVAILTPALGLPLAVSFGVSGAFAASLLTSLISASILWCCVRRAITYHARCASANRPMAAASG